MAINKTSGTNRPHLLVKEISDVYLRRNFQELFDFFQVEDQVLGYKFFDYEFEQVETGFKITHDLGYIPQDVIVSQLTGTGAVQFNFQAFDRTTIEIDVDGPCRIRFLVGLNRNGNETLPLGSMKYYADPLQNGTFLSEQIPSGAITEAQLADGILGPRGAITAFGAATPPDGWLICDGSAISRTTYAKLFAVIGTNFGAGNGSESFNLPDLRGRFLRGWDNGVGRDPDSSSRTEMNPGGNVGDLVGSVQNDAFQSHRHSLTFTSMLNMGAAGSQDRNPGDRTIQTNAVGNPTTGSGGTIRVSTETRPQNANIIFIIKY